MPERKNARQARIVTFLLLLHIQLFEWVMTTSTNRARPEEEEEEEAAPRAQVSASMQARRAASSCLRSSELSPASIRSSMAPAAW